MYRYLLRNANQQVDATRLSSMSGGEGYLCTINGRTDVSLKIFVSPPPDLESRLQFLIANFLHSICAQLAWPLDIVEDDCGRVVGYLQTHFSGYQTLTTITDLSNRPPWITDADVRRYAYQIASIIAELNAHDFLFPDLHLEQFLVAQGKNVVLIDTAGCQFQTGGQFFPCHKVRPDCQAPELLVGSPGDTTVARRRSVYTDAYSLAKVIFNLIMHCDPYSGVHVGTGKPVSAAERARRGIFPFDHSCQDYRPPPTAPPYRDVDPNVKDFFRQCFVDGAKNPQVRPTAEYWAGLLRHIPVLSKKRHIFNASPSPIASPSPAPTSPAVTTAPSGPPSAKAYINLAAAVLLLLGGCVVGNWLTGRYHEPAKSLPDSIADSPWTAEMLWPSSPTSGGDIAPLLNRFRLETSPRKQPEHPFVDPYRSDRPNQETIP